MILCLGTTPATQRVMVFSRLALDNVNRAHTTLDGAAGKSINVAKVLQVLGERPIAVGFLGGIRGQQLREMLETQGIGHDMLRVSAPTRECITVIDQAAGAITELVEEGGQVPSEDYERLIEIVRRRTPQCRAVVMSGTIPAGGPADLYAQCIRCAQQTGALTLVDGRGAPLDEALKVQPSLVKPNLHELEATLGRKLDSESAVLHAMRELVARGARQVVITSGKNSTLAHDGYQFWRVQSPTVEAVNPIGSGDAFTAGLVWRLLRGDNLGEACRWASAVGAANALTLMTGDVNRQDVDSLISQVRCESLTC